jgi:glutamate synthase domain-containing protein 2
MLRFILTIPSLTARRRFTMSKPNIADTKPTPIELKAGETKYWCACGLSANQPFCDGSHKTTSFTPLAFTAEEDGTKHLCMCKHTKNPPYCDGSHAKLTDDDHESMVKKPDAPSNGAQHETGSAPTASASKEEPTVAVIHDLAKHGLKNLGHHGEMGAMGVPTYLLPQWNDIQILPAQMAHKPLLDGSPVSTEVIIGSRAKKPLTLNIPLFVSDMSFGSLSQEAKTALAKGAELAGTGICSGEGGMLPEEQAENKRYFYELASAMYGFSDEPLKRVQAFHFKGGQAAKTGTGGHLPSHKVTEKIAEVRGLTLNEAAISPATFVDLNSVDDFRQLADHVREISGGVPIGFKLSANHIEADIQFALDASADYIILDGRGGGTGAAPLIFRDHISIPTMAAIARARHYLDKHGHKDVTLIAAGGMRTAPDFIKAMALGADAIAIANSALQSIGCVAARMCNTNLCPAGVATQDPELRKRIDVDASAQRLANFFGASTELMQVMARACGHDHLNQFSNCDITTWKKDIAELTGIEFAGFDPQR